MIKEDHKLLNQEVEEEEVVKAVEEVATDHKPEEVVIEEEAAEAAEVVEEEVEVVKVAHQALSATVETTVDVVVEDVMMRETDLVSKTDKEDQETPEKLVVNTKVMTEEMEPEEVEEVVERVVNSPKDKPRTDSTKRRDKMLQLPLKSQPRRPRLSLSQKSKWSKLPMVSHGMTTSSKTP